MFVKRHLWMRHKAAVLIGKQTADQPPGDWTATFITHDYVGFWSMSAQCDLAKQTKMGNSICSIMILSE